MSKKTKVKKQPLSYQAFKKLLFEKHPETKTYTRTHLRRIYRDYKKERRKI